MIDPQYIVSNRNLEETKEYQKLLKEYKYYKDPSYKIFFFIFVMHALIVLGNYLLVYKPSKFIFIINYVGFIIILIDLVFFVFKLKRNSNYGIYSGAILVAFIFLIL